MSLTGKTVFFFGLILILSGVYGILQNEEDSNEWTVSDEGILSFPTRGDIVYSMTDLDNTGNSDILRYVSFESQDIFINGLLRIPESNTKVPAIVLLPGAGVTKENEQGLASVLSNMGYASITLDQRNLGGINLQGDLEMFKSGIQLPDHSLKLTDSCIFFVSLSVSAEGILRILSKLLFPFCDERWMKTMFSAELCLPFNIFTFP